MANDIKIKRFESLIQDRINKIIVTEINDPKLKMVRVTYVKLTKDLSQAVVHVDSHYKNVEILNKLKRVSGLFRSKIATDMNTFRTPVLIFKFDKSIEYAQKIDKIIEDIKKDDESK